MIVDTLLGGRYRLESELGAGGMARVYRAFDTSLDRPVAVKILRDQYGDDPGFRERFAREARAAGRLGHPNIVAVYDVGEEGQTPFIVMQLVDGRSLREVLSAQGALPVDQAIEIGVQVAGALAFSHQQGIVHRDVKPENILIAGATGDALPGQIRAYLADFGIAQDTGESSLTTSNAVFGSVAYLSPERGAGHPATPASDVYALGVVLFEMLAGRRPFEGDSPVSTVMAHTTLPVPSVRSFNPAVSPALDEVISKSLAKLPVDRFETAAQMSAALLAARAGAVENTAILAASGIKTEVLVAPASRLAGPPASAMSRRLWLAVGAVALLGLVFAGGGAMAASMSKNRTEAAPAVTAPAEAVTPEPALPTPAPQPTSVPDVKVPRLEGMEINAARQALTNAGLVAKDGPQEFNASVPASHVIRTNPGVDSTVAPGSTVELVVSKGVAPAPPPQPGGGDNGKDGPAKGGRGNGNGNGDKKR